MFQTGLLSQLGTDYWGFGSVQNPVITTPSSWQWHSHLPACGPICGRHCFIKLCHLMMANQPQRQPSLPSRLLLWICTGGLSSPEKALWKTALCQRWWICLTFGMLPLLFGYVTNRKGHFESVLRCHTHAMWQRFMHPGGLIFRPIFPKRLNVDRVQAACWKMNQCRTNLREIPSNRLVRQAHLDPWVTFKRLSVNKLLHYIVWFQLYGGMRYKSTNSRF